MSPERPPMTQEERTRNLERRMEVLEAVFLDYRRMNAHNAVGGEAWVRLDDKAIQEARHAES